MTKIILLNGPPRCGKDTLSDGMYLRLDDNLAVYQLKMADPIHELWSPIFGGIPEDKNKIDERFGMSYRQCCISFSEEYMKPNFGQDIFGKILTGKMKRLTDRAMKHNFCDSVCIISDSGFLEESVPVIEEFGAENILLVKIVRDGCDFSNDSRGYLNLDDFGVKSKLIHNTTLDKFLQTGVDIVTEFVNSPAA